jgi:hypothetical protein
MNPDLGEVGTLVTAGLAAHEVDAVSVPDRHPSHAHANCLNCGASLSGAYCNRCGQPAHLHRSLLHLGEEFLHGVLHFDAKGFRTVPLLFFRPGLLTRRYIEGQRTRYVSPMALFLFCIFLVYVVFSSVGGHGTAKLNLKIDDATAAKADVAQAATEVQADMDKASADLAAARKSGVGVKAAEQALAEAQFAQKLTGLSAKAADAALVASEKAAKKAADKAVEKSVSAGSRDSPVTLTMDSSEAVKSGLSEAAKGIPDVPGWKGRLRADLSNPDLLLYKLKNTAYKYSFMLIPISLPFLWMMFFWKRGVRMYDHAIFSLYSISFMCLLFTLLALINATGLPSAVAPAVLFVPPVHMFMQLRETYSLSIFSALWRTFALLSICGTAFILFLAFIVVMVLR